MNLLLRTANILLRSYFVYQKKKDSSMTCRSNGEDSLFPHQLQLRRQFGFPPIPSKEILFLSRYFNIVHLPTTTFLRTNVHSFAGDTR